MAEGEYFVGSVAVGIVPSARGFAEKVRAAVVPSADNIGAEFGKNFSTSSSGTMGDMMGRWGQEQSTKAKTAGARTGQSYAESFRAKIDEILRDLPDAHVKANTTEAQEQVQRLRTELEELKSKEIGVDMTNAEAMAKIDEVKTELHTLADHPTMVNLAANITEASARVEELRGIAEKPIVVPVKVVPEGGGAKGAAGADAAGLAAGMKQELEVAGEQGGAGFGSRFMGRIKTIRSAASEEIGKTSEGMVEKMRDAGAEAGSDFGGTFGAVLSRVSRIGVPVAIAGAVVAVTAVMGEKLELAQKSLELSLKAGGDDWEEYKDRVKDVGREMSDYGYTQDQVDQSIRQVYQVTGNMNDALKAQSTIANLAASQHLSLAQATMQYDRALAGNGRTLRQLGIQQAQGTTEAQAMSTAQKMLASSVQQAGGMAHFAEIHHMTLAEAQKTVSGATHGNIRDFNKLGIEVLPKSASAAQNFAQVQAVLNARMGGQAAARAESFGGKIQALRAKFENAAESIGVKMLPYLDRLIDAIIKILPVIGHFATQLGHLVQPVVGLFFDGLKVIFMALHPIWKQVAVGIALVVAGWIALKIAMMTNPFIALATALIILIGLIYKYRKQIYEGLIWVVDEVRHYWSVGWNAVKNFFVHIWDSIYNFIRKWGEDFLALLGPAGFIAAVTLNIIKYHRQIENTFTSVWHAIYNFLRDILGSIEHFFVSIWNSISHFFTSVWDGMYGFIRWVLNRIKTGLENDLNWIHWIWTTVWDRVKNTTNALWGWMRRGFSTFWDWLKRGFQDAVNAVARIWNQVENAAKKPVQFIVGTVYNKGIVPVVNDIAGVFGMHPLKTISGFARGTGGAPPGWAWVGEEGPELVNMTGGETVLTHAQSMATGLWGQGPGFATGTAPSISPAQARVGGTSTQPKGDGGNPLSGIVHAVEHGFGAALKELRNLTGDALGGAIDKIVNPLIDRIPGLDTKFGQYTKRVITSEEQKLVDFIKGISTGPGGSASGSAILADAVRYNGHRYVYGGPSNPQGGWDCSSFVSYVLGHDMKLGIPGGSWARVTNSGRSHGPVASAYKHWSGARDKGDQNVNNIAPGDLLTWDTHVGFGAGRNRMFSAYDTAQGTIYTPATAGPRGEQLVIRQLKAALGGNVKIASGNVGAEERYAQSLFGLYGWGAGQLGPLINLWNKESGWNPNAVNPSSGAYGIPQALGQGHPYNLGDAAAQIRWGLKYIKDRYGSPAAAWAHEVAHNWYAMGTGYGGARTGWAWVGERGPELVRFHGGEDVLSHQQSLSALSQVPGSGYINGTVGRAPGQMEAGDAASLKTALRGVEDKLDKVVKATQRVGGDVGSALNAAGRSAGGRAAFNNGMR